MLTRSEFDKLYQQYPFVITNPSPEQLYWLVEKAASINPKTIVEIGVMNGAGLKAWEQILNPGDLLVGIDSREDLYRVMSWDWVHSDRQVRLIQSDSRRAIEALKAILGDRKIDFLYIDGWHEDFVPYEDFEKYVPLVRVGGIVGIDDIGIVDGPYPHPHPPKVGTCGTMFKKLQEIVPNETDFYFDKGMWRKTSEQIPKVR